MLKIRSLAHSLRFCLISLALTACAFDSVNTEDHVVLLSNGSHTKDATPADASVSWAVNIGGPAHLGADGINYLSDNPTSKVGVGHIESISGAQDDFVYQTYRVGELSLRHPVDNGVYSVTFKFAEPHDVAIGARVFDTIVNGQKVLDNLDVRLARDGNTHASLDRTVPDVRVENGIMDIALKAVVGDPILSGLVVRKIQDNSVGWNMVWGDEFNQDSAALDETKWNFDIWPARKVNDEDQAYTSRQKNVRVENGRLILEAHLEEYDDAQFTSGRVHSAGKGDMLYGRAEIRAKLPAGQGTWSALWMLPTDPFKYATTCNAGEDWQGSDDCDAWPNSGEIDIMEHVGYDMNRVHGTVHTKAYYWVNGKQRKATIEASPVDQQFHVYAIEWSPERIDIFMDDILYFTYLNESEGWQAWPFDHPYHLVLNLAVGGAWGRAGGPIDKSLFPTQLEIDFVRVYEKQVQTAQQ